MFAFGCGAILFGSKAPERELWTNNPFAFEDDMIVVVVMVVHFPIVNGVFMIMAFGFFNDL